MELRDRLTALARIEQAPTPVVSVYLATRWADEHERGRARIFLKNELRRARESTGQRAHPDDLDWVEREGASLIDQAHFPDAHGVALFACHGLSLREVVPVRVPFEDRLVVAGTPFLLPLAAVAEDLPAAVVVFVDTGHARLVPIDPTGADREVVLEAEVPGPLGRGGWAELALSRYQRHIQGNPERHLDAVAETVAALVAGQGAERIVLAGQPRNVAVFRKALPAPVAEKIVGTVEGSRHEPASAFVARAADVLRRVESLRQAGAVDAVLTEAAKSGQAVAGLSATLGAINRGAVQRLYVARGFSAAGHACAGCGALAPGEETRCRLCGAAATRVALDEAMADRVLAAGGRVEVVDLHGDLARVGGVAAQLRYPL